MKPIENKIPRRNRLDLNTPAELAVTNAVQEVERMGADVKLTEAVNLLAKAKEAISDYVDNEITKRDNPSPDSAQPEQEVIYPEGILSFKLPTRGIFDFDKEWHHYQSWVKLNLDEHFEIWSVKNAVGDVFTIDEIADVKDTWPLIIDFGKISKFDYDKNGLFATSTKGIAAYINMLTKAPVKQPLFVTVEDLAVFEGEEYFRVENNKITSRNGGDPVSENEIFFKHRHNAEVYVAENRKSVSWRELKEYVSRNSFKIFNSQSVIDSEKMLDNFSRKIPAPGEDGEQK